MKKNIGFIGHINFQYLSSLRIQYESWSKSLQSKVINIADFEYWFYFLGHVLYLAALKLAALEKYFFQINLFDMVKFPNDHCLRPCWETEKQVLKYWTNAKWSIISAKETNLFQIFNKNYYDYLFIEALSNINLLLLCYPKESKLEL